GTLRGGICYRVHIHPSIAQQIYFQCWHQQDGTDKHSQCHQSSDPTGDTGLDSPGNNGTVNPSQPVRSDTNICISYGAGWSPGMRLFRINQYANTGTIVKATSVDPIMARTTVSANGRKSSPAMPSTNRMGTNTMTVTNVEEITAEETSPVARVIVLTFDSVLGACRKCRMIFSMTTIESSTMRPMVIINPASDIIFTVVPVANMPTKAKSTDNGIVIPVMMVGR